MQLQSQIPGKEICFIWFHRAPVTGNTFLPRPNRLFGRQKGLNFQSPLHPISAPATNLFDSSEVTPCARKRECASINLRDLPSTFSLLRNPHTCPSFFCFCFLTNMKTAELERLSDKSSTYFSEKHRSGNRDPEKGKVTC